MPSCSFTFLMCGGVKCGLLDSTSVLLAVHENANIFHMHTQHKMLFLMMQTVLFYERQTSYWKDRYITGLRQRLALKGSKQ